MPRSRMYAATSRNYMVGHVPSCTFASSTDRSAAGADGCSAGTPLSNDL